MIRCKSPQFDMVVRLKGALSQKDPDKPRCSIRGCGMPAYVLGYGVEGDKKRDLCEFHFVNTSTRIHGRNVAPNKI